MSDATQANHRLTWFTSCATSGIIPVISICLGFILTPPAKYNEVMGDLIPVCVFGFYGALAAVLSFSVTFPIIGGIWLKSLPMPFRMTIALLISACTCAGAVYVGLRHMMGLTPAIY